MIVHKNTKISVHFQGKNYRCAVFKMRKSDAADPTERYSLTFRIERLVSLLKLF